MRRRFPPKLSLSAESEESLLHIPTDRKIDLHRHLRAKREWLGAFNNRPDDVRGQTSARAPMPVDQEQFLNAWKQTLTAACPLQQRALMSAIEARPANSRKTRPDATGCPVLSQRCRTLQTVRIQGRVTISCPSFRSTPYNTSWTLPREEAACLSPAFPGFRHRRDCCLECFSRRAPPAARWFDQELSSQMRRRRCARTPAACRESRRLRRRVASPLWTPASPAPG